MTKQAQARPRRRRRQTPVTTRASFLGTCLRSDSQTNLAFLICDSPPHVSTWREFPGRAPGTLSLFLFAGESDVMDDTGEGTCAVG